MAKSSKQSSIPFFKGNDKKAGNSNINSNPKVNNKKQNQFRKV